MIKGFANKNTEKLYHGDTVRQWVNIAEVTQRKLDMIDAAAAIADLRSSPGNRLEALKGDRKGQHSIRINRQYRICFKWNNGHAYRVEISRHYEN